LPDYIEELFCPNCGSEEKRSKGKNWQCKNCGRHWVKKRYIGPRRRKKDHVPWNKGLTKETSPIIAKGTKKSKKTRQKLIDAGIINPTKNLPPKKYNVSKEELYDLYWNKNLSTYKIARKIGCHQSLISLLLKKYGIKARNRGVAGAMARRSKQPEINRKISRALKGNTNWVFGGNFPNKEEKKIITFLARNNLPFRYVGDGSFLIGGKNPDFICEESKKVIEFFGELWHPPSHRRKRVEFFASYGWDCFVIWGKDMSSVEKRKILLQRLLEWFSK